MKQFIDKSYEINFIMLVSISIVVFVRSLQQNIDDKTRLSLQLSSFVTTIASMHYFFMIQNKNNIEIYRYFDWFFTTPILLIDLCLLLDITETQFMFEIIGYNTFMLLFGYLGELHILSTLTSTVVGFAPFLLLFYRVYQKIRQQNNTQQEYNIKMRLFTVFFLLWTMYGINHMYKNTLYKNGIYNILDLITKGMFGLYIYNSSWNIKENGM